MTSGKEFPTQQLRTLQFDSFFLENINKASEEARENLLPNEIWWLYTKPSRLHRFMERASLDVKLLILAKLNVNYAITIYDNKYGSDKINWVEQICAAQGVDGATKWYENYVHYSHSFVLASEEVHRLLNRLSAMHHSKIAPISNHIKRLRDYKKLQQYENLLKEYDFIYFLLKSFEGFIRLTEYDKTLGIARRELVTLIAIYLEHRPLTQREIARVCGKVSARYSLNVLNKTKYIERTLNPSRRGNEDRHSYYITEEGDALIMKVCHKILQYT